jgi:hypothetical protein
MRHYSTAKAFLLGYEKAILKYLGIGDQLSNRGWIFRGMRETTPLSSEIKKYISANIYTSWKHKHP